MPTISEKQQAENLNVFVLISENSFYIQGVLLPDRQTLRSDSRHEDKHY